MGKSLQRIGDPYEIPSHLVPPGMIYQWVCKKSCGRIDQQYQAMCEAGWVEVPYHRLEKHFLGRYRGEGAEVLVGGQVLMERAREQSVVARDKEIDKALHQAQSGRSLPVNLLQTIKLSKSELDAAVGMNMSSAQYAKARIEQIAHETDDSLIRGWNGSLMFIRPPKTRVVKHRWLGWLFNLISKETTEHFDD